MRDAGSPLFTLQCLLFLLRLALRRSRRMPPSNPSTVSTVSRSANGTATPPTSPQNGARSQQAPSDDGVGKETDIEKNDEKEDRNNTLDERDKYLVDWEPNDPANPRNWSTAYKSWITFMLGMLALAASLGSSIISPAEERIRQYTHISSEVSVLPISFYILGFAFGPMLWAPVSEVGSMHCMYISKRWTDDYLGLGPQVGNGARHVLPGAILHRHSYQQDRCFDLHNALFRRSLWICTCGKCFRCSRRHMGTQGTRDCRHLLRCCCRWRTYSWTW